MNNPSSPITPAAPDMWAPSGPGLWQDIQAPKWEANRTAWLLTCVDLTSLLVGFFVLLFSTQTLQRDQWQAVTGSFQAQFAPQVVAVPMVPSGGDNAVVRVTGVKSGLAYLDTLLHQRMEGDPVWGALTAQDRNASELLYPLPPAELDDAIWGRLGGVLRGWKNPIGIAVTTTQADGAVATQKAVAMAAKLAKSGVMSAFADVRIVKEAGTPVVYLVVRAQ